MSNSQPYITHTLNISKTKQAHIFPKSKRFSKSSKLNTEVIYKLPSTISKRTTSFGFGHKTNLEVRNASPPPGTYHLPSEFEKSDLKNTTSIGEGRQKVAFGSFIWQSLKKTRDNPSPNKYNVESKHSHIGGRMGERIKTQPDAKYKKSIPGPGTYKLQATDMKTTGHYILSTFKNHSSPRFFEQKNLERLLTRQRMSASSTMLYDVQEKEVGKFSNSKYKNVPTRTFSKAKRPGLQDKTKIYIPGFKYRRFSEFGGSFI